MDPEIVNIKKYMKDTAEVALLLFNKILDRRKESMNQRLPHIFKHGWLKNGEQLNMSGELTEDENLFFVPEKGGL